MKTLYIPALLLAAGLFLTGTPCAAGSLFCNDYGNCTGTTDDGEFIQLFRDPYGTTSGFIGDESVQLYSDPYGTTSGFIGDKSVHLYSDPYGGTSGFIGDDSVHSYTDDFGTTIW